MAADRSGWDAEAAHFNDEADHGLRDPLVRAAWAERLRRWLPPAPADVADLGCGTGSLAVLLAGQGHRVTGVDYSAAMLQLARAKAERHRVDVALVEGDAADPPLPAGAHDAVLCRHVLWALPDPAAALTRWRELLRPAGRLVLVEGRWATGVGLGAEEVRALLRPLAVRVRVERLDDPARGVARSRTSGTSCSRADSGYGRARALPPARVAAGRPGRRPRRRRAPAGGGRGRARGRGPGLEAVAVRAGGEGPSRAGQGRRGAGQRRRRGARFGSRRAGRPCGAADAGDAG